MKKIVRKLLLFFPIVFAVISMSGCSEQQSASKEVLARFQGEDITLEELNFYLVLNQVNYEETYADQYPGENIWQKDILGTGQTLETEVKSSIMQQLKQMHILLSKAEELNITLDEKDEEELLILEEVFQRKYSEQVLNEIHAEDGRVKEHLRQSMLAAKVKEVICSEKGWTDENREEEFWTLYQEWAKDYNFTVREVDWSEIHFEQGKYSIKKEEKEENNEEEY